MYNIYNPENLYSRNGENNKMNPRWFLKIIEVLGKVYPSHFRTSVTLSHLHVLAVGYTLVVDNDQEMVQSERNSH